MTAICKNCDNTFEGNFCNNCGQSKDTHKLSMHYIWHDLQHGIFHFDNGIFYTIKNLLTKPGVSIREFIEGKRIRHFKPFPFVIVMATLYGLLYHSLIDNIFKIEPITANDGIVKAYEKVIRWITDHFAYATLILIFNSTVASYQIFKKSGYNFAEHLVLNTFYRGLTLVIALLAIPILYLLNNSGNELVKNYTFMSQSFDFLLMYWCYAQFFNQISKIRTFVLTLYTSLILSFLNLIIGFILGWIVVAFF